MTPTQLLDKICHSFREKHMAAVAEFEAAARADERAKVILAFTEWAMATRNDTIEFHALCGKLLKTPNEGSNT